MLVAVVASAALAQQGFEIGRPPVPSAGIATENGPGALWVNPANLAYDPDARFGLFVTRQLEAYSLLPDGTDPLRTTVTTGEEPAPLVSGPTSFAVTVGGGGASVGVHHLLRPDDGVTRGDWTFSYGTSLRLPERVAVGGGLHWSIVDGDDPNFVAFDAGLSWRPLPWFGVTTTTQNVGSPDPLGRARPRTAAGVALRGGRAAILGLEAARLFAAGAPEEADEWRYAAVARLRPVEGLYLRASGEAGTVIGASAFLAAGLGVEVVLDGFDAMAHATTNGESLGAGTVFLGTDEPDESLVRSRHRVPTLELDATPPYQRRGGLFSAPGPTWLDVLERLRRAEADPEVSALTVVLDGAGYSFARAQELRARLASFEATGRPVTVYLENPTQLEYYVASAARTVLLHPAGGVDLRGVAFELQHLRGLLDKVGVKPDYVKRSEYKGAPESFTETEPTAPHLEQMGALADGFYEELVARLAEARKKERSEVVAWIDGGPHSAQEALDSGMVDGLAYGDELEDRLEEADARAVREDLLETPEAHSAWEEPKQVAVVYVEGGIVGGESSPGGLFSGRTTGSDSVVRALERAKKDPQIRGVVLRVDSPGGSAFASDEIWRAGELLQREGKPLVVSMGGLAASGGYYVASGADAIWAEPTTITGSIGVFSGKFSTAALEDKLGVTTAQLVRGRNATLYSGSAPWDDVQRARAQSLVDQTYDQFKGRVAEGRHLEPGPVEEVARGRVWLGAAAKERGLVDELGSFQDALADARRRAGIAEDSKAGLVEITSNGALLESLAPSLSTRASWTEAPFRALVARLAGPPPGAALEAELAPLTGLLPWSSAALLPLLHPEVDAWALEPLASGLGGDAR